ncbi:hypothetical protein HJC23_006954 [Cyclotella cryptica]|uniref:Fungal lipase-like domain-containing protein n=1 Tax=Cyclotella cryptica TaxID=29204 RepID=A0ABD3PAX5_9STRA|eukprot:CCRYP_016333-RA/>CCRYP_016333-RA protein AED:0.34 eAED:0.25 QI:0/-1/0/1/-1/1/1/0/389
MPSLKSTFLVAYSLSAASSQQQNRALRNSNNSNGSTDDLTASSYTATSAPLLVDYLYTYGAPSVTLVTHQSNPNNACIPGTRVYTEDVTSSTVQCAWYQFWCKEESGTRVTNVDFASKINLVDGYMHPKMDTLALRNVDGKIEYNFNRCQDGVYQQSFQWWPGANEPSDMIPGFHIHSLQEHYEARLMQISDSVSSPMLDYASAARCTYADYDGVSLCLLNYQQEDPNGIPGVTALGYELFAHMNHVSQFAMTETDNDAVIVLKNDNNPNYRKCIIAFKGSDSLSDFADFAGANNNPTYYCGRGGIHSGVKKELWSITHDSQYASSIKPALETCHEVTCVGHSLGGSLCNLFTMCANQGMENLDGGDGEDMWDDYYSLSWTKMKSGSSW